MSFLDLYLPALITHGSSVFAGGPTPRREIHYLELPKSPIVQAFLEDDDIQEITIASGNIGFVRTFTKQFKSQGPLK